MPRTLALPIVVAGDGGLAALEQGSPADLAQSIGLLLDTRPGERAAVPEYGLPDPIGAGLDPDQVVQVVLDWEERADPADVQTLAVDLVDQAATLHTSAEVV